MRGRNLHDTERYDQLSSTSMTLSTAKRNVARAAERRAERRGGARGGKSGCRDEGERVTTRGSHQRLFCGFDSHWLASDRHFPHPSSFRRYSPPSSYLSSLSRTRIPTLRSSSSLSRRGTCRGKVFHPDSCLVHLRGFSSLFLTRGAT